MVNAPLKGFDPGQFQPLLNTPCLLELTNGQTVLATLERVRAPDNAVWRVDTLTRKFPRDRAIVVPAAQVKQWAHIPEWRANPLVL